MAGTQIKNSHCKKVVPEQPKFQHVWLQKPRLRLMFLKYVSNYPDGEEICQH